MSANIDHPPAHAEGGLLQRGLRVVAEFAGNVALGGAALVAGCLAFAETIYDFDEHLEVPFDKDGM